MGMEGKLTKDRMGANMPVHAPTCTSDPVIYYRKGRTLIFTYETEDKAAASLLPSQLRLTDVPTVSVFFNDFPWTTVGRYKEVVQAIHCLYGGQEAYYCVHLILDQEAPILGGRERAGFPKKLGYIEAIAESDLMGGFFERPKGIRICSCLMRPETPLEMPPDGTTVKFINLRAIPAPESDKKFSLLELVQMDMIQHPIEMWSGKGSCYFTGASDFDPWHHLPIKKMFASVFTVMDFELTNTRILETL